MPIWLLQEDVEIPVRIVSQFPKILEKEKGLL